MADKREEFAFTINKDFAKKFEKNKRRSELEQLKAKYGDVDSESSSSSETEDEDAKEVTSQKEKEFLTVLSLLKKKDPKIYDKETHFYKSESSSADEEQTSKKPQKPVYLKDYERQQLLEKGSKAFISDEDDDEEDRDDRNLTYNDEQKALKDSFKTAVVENGDEEEDFLKPRQKTEQEKQKEEEDYKKWLKGVKKDTQNDDKDLDALQRFWNDPNLDGDEQFLRNYILDKGYMDKADMRIPTYNEIVDENEDEDELEKQEEFERKYNFRYEEPDSEFIKTFSRTVRGTVRQKDDKRSEARKKREERKKKEKELKREELKRLKNLKKKEIQEKLQKLKDITGNPNVGFTEDDMEGDFDPKKYDDIMQKVFHEDYYQDADDEKPAWLVDGLDLGDEEENWDEWEWSDDDTAGNHDYADEDPNADYDESNYDNGNFNMDADYDASMEEPKPKRQRNKRSTALSRALDHNKPLFDPNEKTFEEYFDEYYKLDYEDIIDDLPCRFKYRSVLPNDYGLTADEIIKYPEKELNQWVSVKKMSQYRTDEEERRDFKKYRKVSQNEQRKKRVFISQSKATENEAETNQKTDEISKEKEPVVPDNNDLNRSQETRTENLETRAHRKQKRFEFLVKKGWKKRLTPEEAKAAADKKRLARQFKGADKRKLAGLSADRLAAYGMKKKKKTSD